MQRSSIFLQSDAVWGGGSATGKAHWDSSAQTSSAVKARGVFGSESCL